MEAICEAYHCPPPRCGLLRRRLDLVQFDTPVNMGVGRATRFLQAAVKCRVDGDFRLRTEKATGRCDATAALQACCDARRAYYQRLVEKRPERGVFLKGCTNLVNALRTEVGLQGFREPAKVDFGDAGYIARVPDISVDPDYDFHEGRPR